MTTEFLRRLFRRRTNREIARLRNLLEVIEATAAGRFGQTYNERLVYIQMMAKYRVRGSKS